MSTEQATGSSAATESPRSRSSSSSPWWRSPERLVATAGAIALRFTEHLGPWETTAILALALGAPISLALLDRHRRRALPPVQDDRPSEPE